MENKHPPGPWTVKRRATKYPDLFTYDIEQAELDPDYNCICGITSGLDSKADAQLIATAPELLEACKYVVFTQYVVFCGYFPRYIYLHFYSV